MFPVSFPLLVTLGVRANDLKREDRTRLRVLRWGLCVGGQEGGGAWRSDLLIWHPKYMRQSPVFLSPFPPRCVPRPGPWLAPSPVGVSIVSFRWNLFDLRGWGGAQGRARFTAGAVRPAPEPAPGGRGRLCSPEPHGDRPALPWPPARSPARLAGLGIPLQLVMGVSCARPRVTVRSPWPGGWAPVWLFH